MADELFATLRQALQPALHVERELGGGGMSRVFVAHDVALERSVVVKVLPPERAAALSAERFRREILIAAKLQHPNIVPVLATGASNGLLWYSMPYVSGRSLRHRLTDHGAIPLAEALPMLRDIARALAVAHKQGIVHRDIKPENILLTEDGAATVTDFGIAKALDSARTLEDHGALTQAGSSIGTPHYMAPEQIAGDPHIDGRVDIYAFGIVAYELLAGRTPFHGRPNSQVLSAHLAEAPPALRHVAPTISEPLAALIHGCLAKDPAERPQTADEIVQRLDMVATTGSIPQLHTPAFRRKRRIMWSVAAVLVVSLAGTWQWQRGKGIAALDMNVVAVAPFRVVGGTADLDWLREGMLDLLASKLTGEGGIKAASPRAMLSEWHALRAQSEQPDTYEPSINEAQHIARRIGAGRLLLGEILPSAEGVEFTATVVDVQSGAEVGRYQSRGSRDSVIALADQLGAQLLTGLSGEGSRRSSPLTRVSLTALRPYLEGQSLLRKLKAPEATVAFFRALEVDSTFALAGIGAVLSTSWYGDQPKRTKALEIAQKYRAQLSPRDQALLRALTGPRYPAPPSSAELLIERAHYLTLANDSPEAWSLYGDHIFHYGAALGIKDHIAVAVVNFRQALKLDSAYVPGYSHLYEIALAHREDSLVRRIDQLQTRFSTAAISEIPEKWLRAVAYDDTTALKNIEDALGPTAIGHVFTITDYALSYGVGLASAIRMIDRGLTSATSGNTRNLSRMGAYMYSVAGAPTHAAQLLEGAGQTHDDPIIWTIQVRMALAGDGDQKAAERAVAKLGALDAAPIGGPDSVILIQREATRAVGLWKLLHGDTSSAVRDIRRQREVRDLRIRNQGGQASTPTDVHPELFDALLAAARHDTTQARVTREALHTALGALNWSDVNLEREVAMSLMAARLFIDANDVEKAIVNASRNTIRNGGTGHPYRAVQWRMEATLAEQLGDTVRACYAWTQFIQLRVRPEPAMQAELSQARLSLQRLKAKGCTEGNGKATRQ